MRERIVNWEVIDSDIGGGIYILHIGDIIFEVDDVD